MKTRKAASAEDCKLITSFEEVRRTLLDDRYVDRLDKPLAFWALPNDRRLPLAFLGRTLRDLLSTSFEDLSDTPGIGQKKISTLVKLLHRASNDHPPAVPFGLSDLATAADEGPSTSSSTNGRPFDPAIVSEALWSLWRDAVRSHHVGSAKLGRLAPSLQSLPTVTWHVPLDQYLDYSLAEIRQLRTHGDKRIRAVLEVFHAVHEKLARANSGTELAIRLVPRQIASAESWIAEVSRQDVIPGRDEVRDRLALPLLQQIRIDSGPTVYLLASGRLGVHDAPLSVRTQSREMGVTRARVYQLLDDCSKVMNVRWPEGRTQLGELAQRFREPGCDAAAEPKMFRATRELFFPEKFHLDSESEDPEETAGSATAELAEAHPPG